MLTKEKFIKELNTKLPSKNVITDIQSCVEYSQDASYIKDKTNVADAVIFVESIEQVQSVVKLANKYEIPIICRGAGTNTVGSCIPVHGGIVLNFEKMNKILDITPQNMTARVQPGVIVGDLQKEAEKVGLFYPPDPSNLKVSTIGGSIAQNSAGARCFKYGATKDYIIDMLVVTADGELLRTGSNTIKNAAGYNLGSLFIGSEGTLGIVVEATVKLIPKPQDSQVIMAYFDSVEAGIECVNEIINRKVFPSTIDFMDKNVMTTVNQYCPQSLIQIKEAALLIEVDGTKASIEEQKTQIIEILNKTDAVNIQYSTNKEEYDRIWSARRSSMIACAKIKPDVTTDDVIVPRKNLAKLVKGIQDICKKYSLTVCLVGHVGDGSVHPQIPIDLNDTEEYQRYKKAKSEIYQLTIDLDGTISGEHGIGLEKRDYLPNVTGGLSIEYMRKIKKVFDPKNILNPYKIF
ncbi:FAD-binding protein [bacterium]|nr:FAD-binding protein [bacterium]